MKPKEKVNQEQIDAVIAETEKAMVHTGQIGKIQGLHFECLYCPTSFKRFKELVDHWQKFHKDGKK